MSSVISEWPRPTTIKQNTVCGYCNRRRLPAEFGWAYIYPADPEDRTAGKLACPDCAPALRAALIESGVVRPVGWERAERSSADTGPETERRDD